MLGAAEAAVGGAGDDAPGCSAPGSPFSPLRRRLSMRTPAGGRRTAAGPPLVATPVGKTPIVRWTGAEVQGGDVPPSAFGREALGGRRLSLAPHSPERAGAEEAGAADEFDQGGQERATQRTFVFTTRAARERVAREAAEAEAADAQALEAEKRAAREVADSILALGQGRSEGDLTPEAPSVDGSSEAGQLDTCPATVELGQCEAEEKPAGGQSPQLIAPNELFPEGVAAPASPEEDAGAVAEDGDSGFLPPPLDDGGAHDLADLDVPELEAADEAPAPPAEKKKPPRRTGGGAKGRATREAARTRLSMDFHGVEGTFEDLQGRRRSSRQKFQPLEYWRNEKKVYGRDIKSMPTVKEVVVQSPDPLWPRSKPRNAQE